MLYHKDYVDALSLPVETRIEAIEELVKKDILLSLPQEQQTSMAKEVYDTAEWSLAIRDFARKELSPLYHNDSVVGYTDGHNEVSNLWCYDPFYNTRLPLNYSLSNTGVYYQKQRIYKFPMTIREYINVGDHFFIKVKTWECEQILHVGELHKLGVAKKNLSKLKNYLTLSLTYNLVKPSKVIIREIT